MSGDKRATVVVSSHREGPHYVQYPGYGRLHFNLIARLLERMPMSTRWAALPASQMRQLGV